MMSEDIHLIGVKMKKKATKFSINILSILIILTCVLLPVFGETNAWFTSEQRNGIQISASINNLNLKVYQDSVADANRISDTRVIALSGVVKPDTDIGLTLLLDNADVGGDMFVRFSFVVKAKKSDDSEVVVPTSLSLGSKFVQSVGYYYYQSSSGRVAFPAKTTETMMTSFRYSMSDFKSKNLSGSETLRIYLTVEASLTPTFD